MKDLERIEKIVDDMVDIKADLENDIKSQDARDLSSFMTFMPFTFNSYKRYKPISILDILDSYTKIINSQ